MAVTAGWAPAVIASAACFATIWLMVPAPDRARSRLRAPRAAPVGALERPPGLPRRARAMAGAAAGAAAGWFIAGVGLLPAALTAVAVAVGVVALLGRLEPAALARERHRLLMDLPVALELLASCLSAGAPLRQALPAVVELLPGPLGRELGRVAAWVDLGADEERAWRELAGHPLLGRLARDIARATAAGAPLAEVFSRHAEDARADRRAAIQGRAKTAGVRSVLPVTLCFLPAFFLVGVVPIVASAVIALLPGL